jgi:hypothetical protein
MKRRVAGARSRNYVSLEHPKRIFYLEITWEQSQGPSRGIAGLCASLARTKLTQGCRMRCSSSNITRRSHARSKTFPGEVRLTADPSAALGMTKGRAALILAAVTGDGQNRRLSAIFIPSGGPQAHASSANSAKDARCDRSPSPERQFSALPASAPAAAELR